MNLRVVAFEVGKTVQWEHFMRCFKNGLAVRDLKYTHQLYYAYIIYMYICIYVHSIPLADSEYCSTLISSHPTSWSVSVLRETSSVDFQKDLYLFVWLPFPCIHSFPISGVFATLWSSP